VDGDPLTYAIDSQPTNGSAAVVGGQLEYTPDEAFVGLDSFTYVARDSMAESEPAHAYISVGVINNLPSALDDSAITHEDTPVVIDVLVNDSDLDSGTLSVISASDPPYGEATINTGGGITYTPQADYNGPDSFTYQIADGQGGTAQALVTVTVNPINDAPNANQDTYLAVYMTQLTVLQADGLLANDTDVEGDILSVALVSGPAYGQLALNPDGSFIYTPDARGIHEDTFTYYVTDGAAQSVVTTVTVVIQTYRSYLPWVSK
jgi:VCBS repeat-containing protein